MMTPMERDVLEKIRPTIEERTHTNSIAQQILEAVARDGRALGMMVGSVARDTWIHGDRDVDIFLLFDPSLTREQLEQEGLSLARGLAASFGAPYREKYAEHPYINAIIDGLDIDLVPCYHVEKATGILSSVDRTPFHTQYIREKIKPYIDDVLLLKQFSKAGGVYGSDQMTEGFSGYLCELLILHYGGFIPLLQEASGWRPGTLIDLEGHRGRKFDEPLVVIDPVDPGRNVSASVSLERMFEFVELARGYLAAPTPAFFFPPEEAPFTREMMEDLYRERGTLLFGIRFTTPPYIPDVVVPQLRKSLASITNLLERNGFAVNHSDCCMQEEECLLLFELLVDTMPRVVRHIGPPLWSRANAEKFAAKYQTCSHAPLFAGPFIEDGRYVVEIARRHMHVEALLGSADMLDVALGKHIRIAMEDHWTVCSGADCWTSEFAPFLSRFVKRESPLMKILRRY